MGLLYSLLMIADVLLAIGMSALILLQHGRGADAGAAFGSGSSGTVFGARGSASFLSRVTAVFAALFFVNSAMLAYLASHQPTADSVIQEQAVIEETVEEVELAEEEVLMQEVPEAEAEHALKHTQQDSHPDTDPSSPAIELDEVPE